MSLTISLRQRVRRLEAGAALNFDRAGTLRRTREALIERLGAMGEDERAAYHVNRARAALAEPDLEPGTRAASRQVARRRVALHLLSPATAADGSASTVAELMARWSADVAAPPAGAGEPDAKADDEDEDA
jgi:hypothetical protein